MYQCVCCICVCVCDDGMHEQGGGGGGQLPPDICYDLLFRANKVGKLVHIMACIACQENHITSTCVRLVQG